MRQRSAGRVHYGFRGPSFRALLIVSFITAAGFLFFGRSNTPVFDGMRSFVDGATGGFYKLVGPPIATAREFAGNVFRIFEVFGENERLRAENAELEAWKAQAMALQQRVARYDALLEMPLEPDIQYRTGRVVDDPGGPFVRTFRINLGTKNGVVEGQGVMDQRGLVGRIVAAGETASRILLITDLNSRVPVMIEPSGVRGMLIGQNDAPPVVAYLPRDFSVQIGNMVMTSGHGGLLPPDIPVGTVTAVKGDQVVIKPATQLASVMYARVLDYASPMADVPYSTKGPPILNGDGPKPTPPQAAPAAHRETPVPAAGATTTHTAASEEGDPAPAVRVRKQRKEISSMADTSGAQTRSGASISSAPLPAPATASASLPVTPIGIGGVE